MGFFDSIKKALGGEEAKPGVTTSPSQLLRQAGIDPSGLKFSFNNKNISVSGTVANETDGARIKEILSAIDGIAAVNVNVSVATPAEVQPEPSPAAPAAPGAPADESADEGRTYVVQSGDTLWNIAKEMYGNGSKYTEIFEANRDILDNPDQIFPGQKLKIPHLDG